MWVRQFLLALLLLPLLARAGGVSTGDQALPVSLPSLTSDGEISLQSLQGKVVYLDFWASWCGPCRVSFPVLEALRQEFADQGFEVYAISVDEDPADSHRFLEEVPVSYPVVIDTTGATPSAWAPPGMPTAYLIDRKGVVRAIKVGFKKNDGEKLRAAITELLGE